MSFAHRLSTPGHPSPPPAFEPSAEKRTRGARIVTEVRQ